MARASKGEAVPEQPPVDTVESVIERITTERSGFTRIEAAAYAGRDPLDVQEQINKAVEESPIHVASSAGQGGILVQWHTPESI